MEIRQLIYFRAIIRTGGFGAAADLCSVAQPSLSQQIKKLEEDLGETLFVRARNGCQLTNSGKLLWEQAKPLLDRWESTERMFHSDLKQSRGQISFGVIPTIAPYLLPAKIQQFHEQLPEVNIDLFEEKTESLLQLILAGELRFAICSDIPALPSGIILKPLFREPLMAAFPHSLGIGKNNVPYAELNNHTMLLLKEGHCLSDQTIRQCRNHDFRASGSIRCETLETLLGMVEANLGIGLVPQMAVNNYASKNIDYCTVSDQELTRQITIISRSDTTFSSTEQIMIQTLLHE